MTPPVEAAVNLCSRIGGGLVRAHSAVSLVNISLSSNRECPVDVGTFGTNH